MITINLSREQAEIFMSTVGEFATINGVVAEISSQIENQIFPRTTDAAGLAVWKHESGLNDRLIEQWKRKHETAEEVGL
ncbi:hypothetical protein [Escherichia phage vB_EcoS_PHB17]|uniref:Uncharacterized protein n=1 Tax=Escherichia phage vB_EcoS_PHB17 TaxID=2591407 RepID=A0A514DKN7_9CAUD|nr:hypothetical protein KMB84_gp21 [Escherichia phage vB_EcoS_PHB17]QDH94224.1 hypothetical protein [Escherichia phage vB_EcoS_PHB17]